MVELLVIADDFTGALDTGVQFTKKGIQTKIIVDSKCQLKNQDNNVQVLAVNTNSRAMDQKQAYEAVYKLVHEAREIGIPYIYKKTDSALRGNIGGELSATIDGSGQRRMVFIPAYPDADRTTENGIQYYKSIPISETAFGRDPFEPVKFSFIPDIIKQQSHVPVHIANVSELEKLLDTVSEKEVCVVNAKSNEDIRKAADILKEKEGYNVFAGCAGFASMLPYILGMEGKYFFKPRMTTGVIVSCGSLNPITERQIKYAEQNGFGRVHLSALGKWDTQSKGIEKFLQSIYRQYEEKKCVIIDSFEEGKELDENTLQKEKMEETRFQVANIHGLIMQKLLETGFDATYVVTGGDTLKGIMDVIGCEKLNPVTEIEKGVVLSKMELKGREIQVVSKSGGFGGTDIFCKIRRTVTRVRLRGGTL